MKSSLILASASPRRQQILRFLGLEFRVQPSDVDEDAFTAKTPREYAIKVAYAKAAAVAASASPGTVVLGADTVVTLGGKVFGKPADADQAIRFLSELSGRVHSVITAVAIVETGGAALLDAVAAKVTFRQLEPVEIERYVQTGEPMDKAGAYAAQGLGGALIERIEGDYFAVVGLPAGRTVAMLSEFMDVSEARRKVPGLTPQTFAQNFSAQTESN